MISLFASTCRGTGVWSLLRTRGLPDSSTDLCLPGTVISAERSRGASGPGQRYRGVYFPAITGLLPTPSPLSLQRNVRKESGRTARGCLYSPPALPLVSEALEFQSKI